MSKYKSLIIHGIVRSPAAITHTVTNSMTTKTTRTLRKENFKISRLETKILSSSKCLFQVWKISSSLSLSLSLSREREKIRLDLVFRFEMNFLFSNSRLSLQPFSLLACQRSHIEPLLTSIKVIMIIFDMNLLLGIRSHDNRPLQNQSI